MGVWQQTIPSNWSSASQTMHKFSRSNVMSAVIVITNSRDCVTPHTTGNGMASKTAARANRAHGPVVEHTFLSAGAMSLRKFFILMHKTGYLRSVRPKKSSHRVLKTSKVTSLRTRSARCASRDNVLSNHWTIVAII